MRGKKVEKLFEKKPSLCDSEKKGVSSIKSSPVKQVKKKYELETKKVGRNGLNGLNEKSEFVSVLNQEQVKFFHESKYFKLKGSSVNSDLNKNLNRKKKMTLPF